jgi:hypothetical protein
VVELTSTGGLLTSVVPETLVATNVPTSNCCSPTIFQPNADFLVAQIFGTTRCHSDVQVRRFSETGIMDTTFTSTPFATGPGENEPQIIVLQPNGQILVGGLTNAMGTPVEGGFARLNAIQPVRLPACWYRRMERLLPSAQTRETWCFRGTWGIKPIVWEEDADRNHGQRFLVLHQKVNRPAI